MTRSASVNPVPDIEASRSQLHGDLVTPYDPGWDTARQAWNLAVDQRPVAVALPESAGDVVAIVNFMREHGLRLAGQGTGHNAAPMGPLDGTVLLRTSRMRDVHIDPRDRRARVGAGALWADVTAPAADLGLAALAGSSADVGVAGYMLGGGISWLARRFGLAVNSLVAAEIVTADGRWIRTDADHEPDLFWALHGGGGNFGIVTALEFRLFPIRTVYAGALFWPIARAADVLHSWLRWTATVPDEVTSIGRLLQFPASRDIPEAVCGRSFVVVEATFLGDAISGAAWLTPLRRLAPQIDSFATIPTASLSTLHMDPSTPVPGFGDGMLLGRLDHPAIDALVGVAGPGSGSPLLSVELRHLGAELRRHRPEQGAVTALDGDFLMYSVGLAPDSASGAAVRSHLDAVQESMAPWDSGRMYLNFAERPRDADAFYARPVLERLRAIKAKYDPGNMFHANHPIPPASDGS